MIDVFYLHQRDPHVPIEESVGAMAELVQEGKVLHLGLSGVTAEELQAAHHVHPIAALQSEWSLAHRKVEEVLPTCIELGVGVVPYSPQRRLLAAVSSPLDEAVTDVARRHAVSRGQVALAWVQQQAEVWGLTVVPIPGTTRVAHLEENVAATLVLLSAAELKALSLSAN